MKPQFCSKCYKTTTNYTTERTVDAYGGEHVWHTCRTCLPCLPAEVVKVQRLAAGAHEDVEGIMARGGTGWQALARQIQRDRNIYYSAARHAHASLVASA